MGYTYDTAALALGISRGAYAALLAGGTINTRTKLACAALAAGLGPWRPIAT